MAEIDDLSTTDASNIDRFPELQAPSTLNNGARALEGLLARWVQHTSGENFVAGTETGANSLTVSIARTTISNSTTASKYIDGLSLLVDIPSTITAYPLLSVNGHNKFGIIGADGTSLTSSAILAGQKVMLSFDADALSGAGAWQMIGMPAKSDQFSPITTRGDVIRGDTNGVAERLALGAADTVLTSDGTDAAWAANSQAASQAEMETATSTSVFVSPGRQKDHPGHPKIAAVWGVDGTLDRGYNADAMTDTAAGDWTVNFTTDFSDTAYWPHADNEATGISLHRAQILSKAVGSARVVVINGSAVLSETETVTISFSAGGDHA